VGIVPETEADVSPRFVISDALLNHVAELCTAFEHVNPIGEKHRRYSDLFDGKNWKAIRDAMIDTGLIEQVSKASKGPRQQFYRKQFVPADLMASLYKTSRAAAMDMDAFWQALSGNSE